MSTENLLGNSHIETLSHIKMWGGSFPDYTICLGQSEDGLPAMADASENQPLIVEGSETQNGHLIAMILSSALEFNTRPIREGRMRVVLIGETQNIDSPMVQKISSDDNNAISETLRVLCSKPTRNPDEIIWHTAEEESPVVLLVIPDFSCICLSSDDRNNLFEILSKSREKGILPIIGFNVNQQGSKGSVLIRTLGFKYYHIKGADGKYDVYRGGFSTKNGFNFSFRIISDSENELKASPERELLH